MDSYVRGTGIRILIKMSRIPNTAETVDTELQYKNIFKNKNKKIFISSHNRFTVASMAYYILLAIYKRSHPPRCG